MATVDEQFAELQRQLADLVPPGTVAAFAGEVPDTGGVVEVRPGWLLCNGAAVSDARFPRLFQAIQASHGNGQDSPAPLPGASFNLPDYRGLFLRGVAGSRTDRDPNTSDQDRPANHPGGNLGNRVGSVQNDATKLPRNAFTTSQAGAHSHTENLLIHTGGPDVGGGAAFMRGQSQTGNAGEHLHTVTGGGDLETRSKNAYVHWIIKT